MKFHTVTISQPQDHILLVTLNRPEAANALNTQLGQELLATIREINQKTPSPRVVILTGEGGRAFCAGVDLKERRGMTDDAWRAQHHIFEALIREMLDCPFPLIAAVNGAAFGGGCELALACDFIYAAQEARFALPEATLGIMPGMGGTQTLARAVGENRARELVMSGKAFSAEQAHEWGMVNHLCYNGQLMNEVLDIAVQIARNAPLSIRAIKQSMNRTCHLPIAQATEIELDYYNRLIPTHDRGEGIAAFNEKRTPIFKGE